LEGSGHDGEVWIDPGIGFGKTLEHNLLLLRNLDRLVASGAPVLLGVSRKSFLGRLLDDASTGDRLEGALAVQTLAQAAGVRVFRTHDVRATVRASRVARAVLAPGS
jgi:dihydropteroate synthase